MTRRDCKYDKCKGDGTTVTSGSAGISFGHLSLTKIIILLECSLPHRFGSATTALTIHFPYLLEIKRCTFFLPLPGGVWSSYSEARWSSRRRTTKWNAEVLSVLRLLALWSLATTFAGSPAMVVGAETPCVFVPRTRSGLVPSVTPSVV